MCIRVFLLQDSQTKLHKTAFFRSSAAKFEILSPKFRLVQEPNVDLVISPIHCNFLYLE